MNSTSLKVSLLMTCTLIAAAALAPAASAGNGAPACKAHASSKKVCFPKKISGSFTGSQPDWTWTGTTSLKRKKQQTTYLYSGNATYHWSFKPGEGNCTPIPSSGTFTGAVTLAINRTHNPGEGFSYSGSNLVSIALGQIAWDCGYGPGEPAHESIPLGFYAGGFSKRLHAYKGKEYSSTWSLVGSN